MALITWTDEMSVGVSSIDEQHKKLVNMVNALNDALSRGEADAVLGKIFDGLAVYTQKHFQYEEQLFAEHGYPLAAQHKAEHDALVAQVVELKKKLDAGSAMIGIELMKFLKNWLTNHILKSDMAYSSHLMGRKVA